MTDGTVFGAGSTNTEAPQATEQTTQEQSLLNALVGEKQKYKSVEDLAKAYANADEFIQKLKVENEALRKQAASSATLDDVLARLSKPAEPQRTEAAPSLTPEEIAALVEKTVTGRETAMTREKNLLAADKLMKEKFGEKAVEKFNAKATTPELKKLYTDLASQDPAHFVSLFTEPVTQSAAMDTGSQSTANLSPNQGAAPAEWSKEWVQKVRKENPSRYWSADFQYQLQDKVIKNPSLYGLGQRG